MHVYEQFSLSVHDFGISLNPGALALGIESRYSKSNSVPILIYDIDTKTVYAIERSPNFSL